jgi:hypothetical protein
MKELLYSVINCISHDRDIGIHTAEQLVPDPSCVQDETAIAKLKKYELPDSDQIPVELIQAGHETLLSVIHKHINLLGIRKNFLISGRSLLLH